MNKENEEDGWDLKKIQFHKTITIVGRVKFDKELGKFQVVVENHKGTTKSLIDPKTVILMEDANSFERTRYERYQDDSD